MSYVYFIHAEALGAIKIGVAADPWSRLSKIRSDCPCPVALLAVEPGDPARETELHNRFSALRQGGEWFRADDLLLDYIAGLAPVQNPSQRRSYGCAQMSRETGWSRPYCSQLLSGERPITLYRAGHIYRATGFKMGLLANATDEEAATIARLFPNHLQGEAA